MKVIFINAKSVSKNGELMTIQKETVFIESIGVLILFFSVNAFTRDYFENRMLNITALLYSVVLVFIFSIGLILLHKYIVEKE